MKQLQVRALAILMTLWCGTTAQEQPAVPAAPAKVAAASQSGTAAKAKPPERVKPEIKYKALVERRKAEETNQKAVESHLRKIRRDRALEAEKEKDAHEEMEDRERSPLIEDVTKKDSKDAKK